MWWAESVFFNTQPSKRTIGCCCMDTKTIRLNDKTFIIHQQIWVPVSVTLIWPCQFGFCVPVNLVCVAQSVWHFCTGYIWPCQCGTCHSVSVTLMTLTVWLFCTSYPDHGGRKRRRYVGDYEVLFNDCGTAGSTFEVPSFELLLFLSPCPDSVGVTRVTLTMWHFYPSQCDSCDPVSVTLVSVVLRSQLVWHLCPCRCGSYVWQLILGQCGTFVIVNVVLVSLQDSVAI